MGKKKWVIQPADKNIQKSVKTGKGELKLDHHGRALINDETLAREIQKDNRRNMTVSRIFMDDPADRGHHYFWGQMPEPIYKVFDRWRKAEVVYLSPREVYELQNSANFYPLMNYGFPDQPSPVTREVGYDDDRGKRIAVLEGDDDPERPEESDEDVDDDDTFHGEGLA